jgi:hypothetical protein
MEEPFVQDLAIENMCEYYVRIGDYQSLSHMMQLSKHVHSVCQPAYNTALIIQRDELKKNTAESIPFNFFWELGEEINWEKFVDFNDQPISPDEIVIYGHGPFTFHLNIGYRSLEDEEFSLPSEETSLKITGPITLRILVNKVNHLIRHLQTAHKDIMDIWLEMSYLTGLQKEDELSYFLVDDSR